MLFGSLVRHKKWCVHHISYNISCEFLLLEVRLYNIIKEKENIRAKVIVVVMENAYRKCFCGYSGSGIAHV